MNWTVLQTPVDTDFQALAWSGANLVAHGSSGDGVTTSDGGRSWQTLDMGIGYETHGLAYGAGRFVSVGQNTGVPMKGTIYTSP